MCPVLHAPFMGNICHCWCRREEGGKSSHFLGYTGFVKWWSQCLIPGGTFLCTWLVLDWSTLSRSEAVDRVDVAVMKSRAVLALISVVVFQILKQAFFSQNELNWDLILLLPLHCSSGCLSGLCLGGHYGLILLVGTFWCGSQWE